MRRDIGALDEFRELVAATDARDTYVYVKEGACRPRGTIEMNAALAAGGRICKEFRHFEQPGRQ